jgi:general stress protein 26
MTKKVQDFSEIREAFDAYVGDINYDTMTTVDAKGRPRARVLIPVWEMDGDRPIGWLCTYRTPVKVAHLAVNPHTTFSYWSPKQNAVYADTVAEWTEDPDAKRHVWDLYVKGSPPGAGYHPGQFWTGPDDPKFAVLRLRPWRVQVVRGTDLDTRIWQPPRPDEDAL